MKKLLLLIFFSAILYTLNAQTADLRKKEFNIEKSGLAIEGYDPVAYFTQNKAIEGKKEFSMVYESVTTPLPHGIRMKPD